MRGSSSRRIVLVVALIAVATAVYLLLRGQAPGGAAGSRASPLGRGGSVRPDPVARTRTLPTTSGRGDAAVADEAAPPGAILAGWGSGFGQVARSLPQEGNPEAPMSLAVGPGGETFVLDQVNGRLARFGRDGRPREPIPVTQQAPQDLAIARDGTALVLDRLRDKTVAVLKDGRLVGDLPVEGKGIPEGGGVTGVFVDGQDVYVEREHGPSVRIGTTDGKADPDRPEVPGRPTRDGTAFLLAGIVQADAGRAYVNAFDKERGERRFTRELRFQMPLLSLVLLDSDLRGTIYLGALLAPEQAAPFVRVVCLAPADGTPTGSVDLPANPGPEETLREIVVLDDGGMIYAQRSESGVAYVRYDCR